MITSKLTTKAQTTIPQSVRSALHLKVGDELAYDIRADHVIVSKVKIQPEIDAFVEFAEWESEADRKAYAEL